jgi:glycosyltransferase involved in cell wall biosynthesis
MSIELANALADGGAQVWFASAGGPLRDNIDDRVVWLRTDNANDAPFRVAGELAGHLREIGPDVVHSHGGICSVVASMAARRVKSRPARVLTHHSRIFRRAPAPISAWLMRRSADHYIAISTDKRASLEQIGVPAERITLIPNFVDANAVAMRVDAADGAGMRQTLGIGGNALVAAIAGRVLPVKGFDRFVRILSQAAESAAAPVHGIAIGDGPALDDVRHIAANESGSATIHFPGYQSDIFPYLAASDVILFPTSHPEVLPMFLIEAAAAGLPAVCSDIPGNRDIVSNESSGYLVDGADDAYAQRVSQLFADAALRARMGEAGRRIAAERFDKRLVVDRMMQVYASLASS